MNFLTPLYIAGALAVTLPILFHLIRRVPQQRQTFSSLMFLTPTPPRLTRRSRLSNIFLLLLRALALTLLALAFARPFLPTSMAATETGPPGRRIALLVDTSASMRRGDLWAQAQKQVEQALADVTPADEVSLFLFDRSVRPAFTREQWNLLAPSQRVPALQAALAGTTPTWAGTALGDALASVADQLAATEGSDASKDGVKRRIVLVSDLQQGSRAEALQGHQWPDTVRLDVRAVTTESTGNASLQLIRPQSDASDAAGDRPRVRVTSQAGAGTEQFAVAWANEKGPLPTTRPSQVYVPAGQSKIVRIDWPAGDATADRLQLQGDSADFDNTLYVVRPRQETLRMVYVGDDAPDDPNGLSFYLASALGDTPQRRVDLQLRRTERLATTDLANTVCVVISRPLADDEAATVRTFLHAGGDALWVLRDVAAGRGLMGVLPEAAIKIDEAPAGNFSLVSRIDLAHPLFSAFADARFSDFSRVHFWKHRKVTVPDSANAKVLASFDNGDPFLLESAVGRGRLIVATSGWHPADSQLALSTKFVPLLDGLLRARDAKQVETQYAVGDAVTLPAADKPWTLKTPDGREIKADPAALANATDRPGVYTLSDGRQQMPFAVNLAPDESRTTPLAPADLKQWGAKFESDETSPTAGAQQRQAKLAELENRQKLWQWLLVGVLGLIAAETALAGRLSRRAGSAGNGPAGQQVTS
ncbi:MAG TPA: BatA domain-containing protein [Tepidisphaeraceae bacterium]|jgi:hypothetical protein